MGKQKITGADATVGRLSAKKDVSVGSQGFVVSVASVTLKRARVRLSCATTGERSYGLVFAAGDVIKSVYLDVGTAEATATDKTADVGLLSSETNGDTDGFLDGISTASIQVAQGSLVAGSVTRGALLSEGTAASGRFARSHVVRGSNAVTLCSQVAEVQAELVADIIVEYETIG